MTRPVLSRLVLVIVALSVVAGIGSGAAGSAVTAEGIPAGITTAIKRWEPKADSVIGSEGLVDGIFKVVTSGQAACAQPLARGQLAGAVGGVGATFRATTVSAEQGETSLYALSRLLSSHALKADYVAKLDSVGKLFDRMLAVADVIKKISADISSGDCGGALGLAHAYTGAVPRDIRVLNVALGNLLARYT